MRVDCTECRFSETAGPDSDQLPGELLVQHARETGHKLSLTRLDPASD